MHRSASHMHAPGHDVSSLGGGTLHIAQAQVYIPSSFSFII